MADNQLQHAAKLMSMNPAPTNSRVEFANTLRGLAAIAVVVSHYFGVFWYRRDAVSALTLSPELPSDQFAVPVYVSILNFRPLLDWGQFGVALFFLISGFVIPFSLRNATRLSFVLNRILRIFPVYIAGFSITLAALWASSRYFDVPWPFETREVAIHYVPGLRDILQSPNIDGIIWTLEIEMKFYFVCAIAAPLFASRSRLVFLFPVFLTVLCLTLSIQMPGWGNVRPGLYTALAPWLFSANLIVFMFIGTAFYYMHVDRLAKREGGLAALVLMLCFLLLWWALPRSIPIDLAPSYGFALAAFAVAWAFPRYFAANRLTDFLANISYPLYVIHGVAGYVALRILLDLGFKAWVSLSIVTFSAVALSWVLHRLIEKPSQGWSRAFDSSRTGRL